MWLAYKSEFTSWWHSIKVPISQNLSCVKKFRPKIGPSWRVGVGSVFLQRLHGQSKLGSKRRQHNNIEKRAYEEQASQTRIITIYMKEPVKSLNAAEADWGHEGWWFALHVWLVLLWLLPAVRDAEAFWLQTLHFTPNVCKPMHWLTNCLPLWTPSDHHHRPAAENRQETTSLPHVSQCLSQRTAAPTGGSEQVQASRRLSRS